MRGFLLTWASTAALGAVVLLGCGNTGGFGERSNIGVGGGGTGTGSGSGNGSTTGSGSGVGGAATTGAGNGSSTTVTSGNGVTTGGMEEATFSISLGDSSVSMQLADSVEIAVDVTSTGDVGTVTFEAVGLPAGVQADFSPSSVTLGSAGSDSVVLTLTSLSSASVGDDDDFTVVASSVDGDEIAPATVSVNPSITIVIPDGVLDLGGTAQNPVLDAYGPYPISITAAPPVTVYIYNADSQGHQIHSDDGDKGFPHGDNVIGAQSMDPVVRQLQVNGTYNWYLHDQGPGTLGRIVIQ